MRRVEGRVFQRDGVHRRWERHKWLLPGQRKSEPESLNVNFLTEKIRAEGYSGLDDFSTMTVINFGTL